MKINNTQSDAAVLAELGQRLARRRIAMQLNQAELADQAGIGKRTLERIEAGESAQMTSIIRVLRALDLLSGLDPLVPETSMRPMELLKHGGRTPKRVRKRGDTASASTSKPWTWDEPE